MTDAVVRVQGQASSKQQTFISKDKVSLNFQSISHLDTEAQPKRWAKVSKLFLSHNQLFSLDGIEAFKSLTHL